MRHAQRVAERGHRTKIACLRHYTYAVSACLRGDRDAAVASMRACIAAPWGPIWATMARRHLGELLGGAGAVLIAESDTCLRAGGIVDPARFAAAFLPDRAAVKRSR